MRKVLSVIILLLLLNVTTVAQTHSREPIPSIIDSLSRKEVGKSRELNLSNLRDVAEEVGLSNHLFVLAQALVETGNFSSRVCKQYNNLFGLYNSKRGEYYRFARWEDSVVGYKNMIQYRYKGGNYLTFLRRIGYAEDPHYIYKVAKAAKQVYYMLCGEYNEKT